MNGAEVFVPPVRLSSRPDSELLAPGTGMSAVTLRVADLDTETAFYRDGVLLTVLSATAAAAGEPARVVLGRQAAPVVILEHAPELRHAAAHEAGLFHVAIVFDTQSDLAAALYSTATRYRASFTGSSDHLVSEAFYFSDPEGNGVELYWDRARTDWSWVHGKPQMGGSFLDPNAYIASHLRADAFDEDDRAGAKVGHVHLSVGDLRSAHDFYIDKLGFEEVATMGGQGLFVSAGGYHHHMAMNTWNSRGAGVRRPALGLGVVRIGVPADDDLGELAERLRHHGETPGHDGRSLLFADPWGNAIEVAAQSGSAS
jgi:catechol 2,3-dioxygenase